MEGESCWKSSGGRTRLYSWPMADEARSDTIPGTRWAVSEIMGPLKSNGVIHRYISNRMLSGIVSTSVSTSISTY